MKIIDLSHTITTNMPVYPGTEPPVILQANTLEKDGFIERKIIFYSHTGTHLDAPSHILPNHADLGSLPTDQFFGKALCIDLSTIALDTIEAGILLPYLDILPQISFVLFFSGWSRYWGDEKYFSKYPVLSHEAATMLCQYNLKGVGFDTISADREGSVTLPIHRIMLQHMIIIENLTNLAKIGSDEFFFSCLPLKIDHGDGSPVRAVAIYL